MAERAVLAPGVAAAALGMFAPMHRSAFQAAERIQLHVAKLAAHRAEVLEDLVVEVVRLQDFDRLDDLHIVEQDGCLHPGVASRWWGHSYWWAERLNLVR